MERLSSDSCTSPDPENIFMFWVEEEGLFYVLDKSRPVSSGRFPFFCAGYASDKIVGLLEGYYGWTEEVGKKVSDF